MQNIDRLHGKARIRITNREVGQWIGNYKYNPGEVLVTDAAIAKSMHTATPQRAEFVAGLFVLPEAMHNKDEKKTIEDLMSKVVEIKDLEEFLAIERELVRDTVDANGNKKRLTRTFPEAYKIATKKEWAPAKA